MYVCFCRGITDSDIRQTIDNGARNFKEVRDELGVAAHCGKCARLAHEVISDALEASACDNNLFYNVA